MNDGIKEALSAVGHDRESIAASIERTTIVFAALLPILRRLEANRQGAEKEANAKHRN